MISLISDRSHNFREMLGDFVRRRINKRYDRADWKPFLMNFDQSIEERRRGGTRVKISVLVVGKLLFFLDFF